MIDQQVTAGRMRLIYRTILILWLVKVLFDPFERLAALPQSVWVPMGPLSWLPKSGLLWLWTEPALISLKICILISLIFAIWGKGGRTIGLLCAVLLTFQQAIIRGLGDVNHSDLALLLILYIAVTIPFELIQKNCSNECFSQQRQALVKAMAWVFVTPYCLIACFRIVYGMPLVFDPSAMSGWLVTLSLRPTWFGFEIGASLAQSSAILRFLSIGFIVVTLLELLTPFMIVNRVFKWFWLAVMLPFHLMTLPLMNIFFWENMLLSLLLFSPIVAWIMPDDKASVKNIVHHAQNFYHRTQALVRAGSSKS